MMDIGLMLAIIIIFPRAFGEQVLAPMYKGFVKGRDKP